MSDQAKLRIAIVELTGSPETVREAIAAATTLLQPVAATPPVVKTAPVEEHGDGLGYLTDPSAAPATRPALPSGVPEPAAPPPGRPPKSRRRQKAAGPPHRQEDGQGHGHEPGPDLPGVRPSLQAPEAAGDAPSNGAPPSAAVRHVIRPDDPEPVDVSADDDPSDAGGGASAPTRGLQQARGQANRQAAPRLLSRPIVHRLRFCPRCGIAQPVRPTSRCESCGHVIAPAWGHVPGAA